MKKLFRLTTAFCLLISTAAIAQNDWTLKLNGQSGPQTRLHFAMANIGGDKALLFGGELGDNVFNDTWVYDLSDNVWVQKSPASKPSPRVFHRMAYIGDNKVLLFGGNSSVVDQFLDLDDTWLYDLSNDTWTQKNPFSKPSARSEHSMAYIGDDKVMLYGGGSTETWIYDLSDNTWTQKVHTTKPATIYGSAAAYIGGDQVVLFGGIDGNWEVISNTWLYSLTNDAWTQLSPTTQPPARVHPAMAFLGGDQALLYGGYDYSSRFINDTWVYDVSDNTWNLRSTTGNPGIILSDAMANVGENKVVLFRGFGDDDTWVYSGEQPLPYCVPHEKVHICHEGNTICVDLNALDAHLNHGDQLGQCPLTKPGNDVLGIPAQYLLKQNYPNPFNPSTTITYTIPEDADVLLRVFSTDGHIVSELEKGMKAAGTHTVEFDAAFLPSGTYLYRLEANERVLTGTMTLLK